MVPLSYYLLLSGILFVCGVLGFLIKRNIITIFMSIELMLNGVNLSFVAFAALQPALGGPLPGGGGWLEFHAGVSYRNILVYRADRPAPFSNETKTQPPHDIPDRPIADHLPKGPGSDLLRSLMERSRAIFC